MSLPAPEETGTDRLQEEEGGSSEPSSPPPARLIIADDHALVREGMQTLLAKETDLMVVGEAENGQEAIELCRSLSPDLVLMDVRMPKMDGLQATQKIKEEYPQISVLIVTSHENPEYLLDAIRAGAAGYVLKEATRRQLLSAVRRTLEGESPLNQELAMDLLRRLAKEQAGRRAAALSAEAAEKRRGGEPLPESLTARELDILRLIASGKTNRQIAEELTLSRGTVKTHVERIISKLGASDRTRAAVRAIELGLLPGQGEQEQQRW